MTTRGDAEERLERVIRSNMLGMLFWKFLHKPFATGALLSRLRELLGPGESARP